MPFSSRPRVAPPRLRGQGKHPLNSSTPNVKHETTQAWGKRRNFVTPVAFPIASFYLAAWFWIVGLCLASLIATYVMFVEPPPPRKIVLASGSRKGAYFHFAKRYAEALHKEGLSVEVRETAGSVENLRLLGQDGSGVAVAIVQSGVATLEQVQSFSALGSLYREPLWVFYRGDRRLERLSHLEGKRIGVGPVGSGTYAVSMRLLAANGLREPESPSGESRTRLGSVDH